MAKERKRSAELDVLIKKLYETYAMCRGLISCKTIPSKYFTISFFMFL